MLILLVLLALSILLAVAGHIVKRLDRAAEQVRRRREQVDRLLTRGSSGRLLRLSELAVDVLGATPTRYGIEGAAPYVARGEADEKIRGLLVGPGPPYPFVIVWDLPKRGNLGRSPKRCGRRSPTTRLSSCRVTGRRSPSSPDSA